MYLRTVLRSTLAAYPGLTAVRLWRELRERGYAGGYTAVKRAVRDIRPDPVSLSRCGSRPRPASRPRSISPGSKLSSPMSAGDAHRLAVLYGPRLFAPDLGAVRRSPGSADHVLRCHIAALEVHRRHTARDSTTA